MFVLLIELFTVGVVAVEAVPTRLTAHDLLTCVVVIGLGVAAAEMARQVERRRRRFADKPHVNFSSVWTLAAALTLPGVLAVVVVAALYLHLWLRSWRGIVGVYAHRTVFSACNVILSCQVAAWCARSMNVLPLGHDRSAWTALVAVVVVLAYFVVNSTVVGAVIALSTSTRSPKRLIGRLNENLLELATLCMGTLAALLIAQLPWLLVLVFVPLYALHCSALVRQFEQAAIRDPKTGLLNMASWRALAESEFARARQLGSSLGIALINIDHFGKLKAIHGPLVADAVLRAAGNALSSVVRSDDLCGCLGGDEFVVMLPGGDAENVVVVAQRIRERIAEIEFDGADKSLVEITASIGAAVFPAVGHDLNDVMIAADNALFAAKDSGRNQVKEAL
ncbi:GGDEF domain-containing protein [Amycolatopsis sp. cg13]|uniref:GGDEF domain-containing protein n=1 Tax=Amycolatopsis sp. cg13 TaxID=3238807 RepID=UPI003524A87C